MSKQYDIKTIGDLEQTYQTLKRYMNSDGSKPMRLICKRLKPSKTPPQHRAYWYCITQLKEALRSESGIVTNEDELHEWVKQKSGYTKVLEMPDGSTTMVTKSISDKSDDADIENMNFLISFIQQWAAEYLGVNIEVGF